MLACRLEIKLGDLLVYTDTSFTVDKPLTIIYGEPGSGKSILLRFFVAALAPPFLAERSSVEPSKAARMLWELYPGLDSAVSAQANALLLEKEAGIGAFHARCKLEYRLTPGTSVELGVYRVEPPECRRGGLDQWPFLVLPMLEERLWLTKIAQLSIRDEALVTHDASMLTMYHRLLFQELASTVDTRLKGFVDEHARLLLGQRRLLIEPSGLLYVDNVPLHSESSTIINLVVLALLTAIARYRSRRSVCTILLLDLPEYGFTHREKVLAAKLLARLIAENSDYSRMLLVTHDSVMVALILGKLRENLGSPGMVRKVVAAYEIARSGERSIVREHEPDRVPEYVRRGLAEIAEEVRKALLYPLSPERGQS